MAEAAHHCAPFKAVKLNQNKAKNHTTKWWFDTERVQIRKQIRQNQNKFRRHPFKQIHRNAFIQLCSKYRKLLKTKKQQYKYKLINSLEQEQDKNSQTFWKTLATIKKQESINNNL